MIKIPIEIGDIVRVGKFKNKRVKVKSIEYDVYGLPIINGRPLLTMRIEKLMEPKTEEVIKLKDIIFEASDSVVFQKLISDIQKGLAKLLPNVRVANGTISASNLLGKDSKPIVRIDSKAKPTAVSLKVQNENNIISVAIFAMVNNKENKLPKYGSKMFDAIMTAIISNQKKNPNIEFQIVIDHDVSGGFWKHEEPKYPTIKFVYQGT